MESVGEMGKERLPDVKNTIFVAVGKNVKDSESTLAWVVQSFPGKMINILHVHRPTQAASFTGGKFLVNKLKQQAVKAFQEHERQKMHKLLDQYLIVLGKEGVEAGKVWTEMDSVERGIVKTIAQHDIRWLVMGAATDTYYSKKMAEIKSNKAIFVCNQAPISCHIWFSCKGRLIYTRRGRKEEAEIGITHPLLLLNPEIRIEEKENLISNTVTNGQRSLNCAHADGDADQWKRRIKRFGSQSSSRSACPQYKVVRSPPLLPYEEEKTQGLETGEICDRLQQATTNSINLKWGGFGESLERWKAEEDALAATQKAKASESLCAKEMRQRKEMEEMLSTTKQEVERMKNEHEEFAIELQMVQDQRPILERRIVESNCVVKDLEGKMVSAVQLLISLKEKRDKMQIEYGNAIEEVKELMKVVKGEASSLCNPQFSAFTFSEISEATHNFDPSRKIGEGRNGSIYQGLLRHLHVAIKMLPSYGSENHVDFQHQVEVLSRVRHPNLVTLIGTCMESRSVIYEYLQNGNLEDRLACKGNTPSLSWQTRTQIAINICSVLIFLHSNKPPMVHGNLKPTKVLLDANFVSKLSDLGISHLNMIPRDEDKTNPKEFFELTPDLDVYSFGMILLLLLTARPISGVVKDMKCALENGNLNAVLDLSAGEWPLEQALQLAQVGLMCCEKQQPPDLVSDVWNVLEPMKTLSNDSTPHTNSKELRRIPSHFVCPIFQEVMKDPHIAADGFTYEAEAIKGWLKSGHSTSPMTNLKLPHCNLLPNYALHYAIQEWQQQS